MENSDAHIAVEAQAAISRISEWIATVVAERDRQYAEVVSQIAARADLEARYDRALVALREIRDGRMPQVCSDFELCTHEGCRASYTAFAIADHALRDAEPLDPSPAGQRVEAEWAARAAELAAAGWVQQPPPRDAYWRKGSPDGVQETTLDTKLTWPVDPLRKRRTS